MSHCGHQCCRIADNPNHKHADPPGTCPHCPGVEPLASPGRMCDLVPVYERARSRARRASTLRLRWQEARARRRSGRRRLGEHELIRLRAVRRELAVRGKMTYGVLPRL